MKSKLYIPKKIIVGFQKRNDTYTGKLAFINYKDKDDNIKREKSFKKWIDNQIEVLEFDNTPNSGFVLNKNIQRDYYFGSGRTIMRVYDSRDFEFEIGMDNLCGILMNSNVLKNEIDTKCVYAWNDQELILLPINSNEYQESLKYTDLLNDTVTEDDLKVGQTFMLKRGEEIYTYIGKHRYYNVNKLDYKKYGFNRHIGYETKSTGIKHLFAYEDEYSINGYSFRNIAVERLINLNTENEDVSELIIKFEESLNSAHITGIMFDEISEQNINDFIYHFKSLLAFRKKSEDIYEMLCLKKYENSNYLVQKDESNMFNTTIHYCVFKLSDDKKYLKSNSALYVFNRLEKEKTPREVNNIINEIFQEDTEIPVDELPKIVKKIGFKSLYFTKENGKNTPVDFRD